ncbi:MAG TPA: sulfatase [Candidatus Sulfomarinibacteraceae bacterium]|nr:sulfatase [Candidatus Sulfomarinibacteraceae bacterium]
MSPGRVRRRPAPGPIALLALAAAVGAGCGSEPLSVLADLTADPSAVLIAVEPTGIDLGTPSARGHLVRGWLYDERARDSGETFVWSDGPVSELSFHLGWRRELELEIRCRPFQFPGAKPQLVSLELNAHPVAELTLETGPAAYRFVLPASAQLEGRNTLVARYRRVDAPAAVVPGSDDRRQLAVAWDLIRLIGVDPTPVRVSPGVVELPAGARADHFVEAPPGAVLSVASCEPLATGAASVEISVLDDGNATERSTVTACDGSPLRASLGELNTLKRIRLRVFPHGNRAPVGVRLVAAQVRAPGVGEPVAESAPASPPTPVEPRPNLVVYLVDALRTDRLGVYGCERPLSPRLDDMAADSVVFTDAVAQSSWTKASVASIFTGLWPREHGVNGPDDRLPEDLPTLPERLHDAGYRTAAIVANAYVGRPFGFARGFDHFEFIEHTRGRSEVLHERVTAWLDGLPDDGRPFFLYVHTIDPHAPYAPPPPYLERFAGDVADPSVGQVETVRGLVLGTVDPSPDLTRDLRALYDGEVAANDASFGRLLDELEGRGELDRSVVVFTSDHGEAFGEHGTFTHGLDLYREVLAVPLVVRLPGGAGGGRRVDATVQHIDVPPTLLSLGGVAGADELPGSVLLDGSGEPRKLPPRAVLAYLDYWGRTGAAAIRDGWKLIEPRSAAFGTGSELYRLPDDPGETRNLAFSAPVRAGWLLAQLDHALLTGRHGERTRIDSETREQLKALGYLE